MSTLVGAYVTGRVSYPMSGVRGKQPHAWHPPQLVMSGSRLELPGDRPQSNCLCGSITFSNPAALNSYVVHTQPRENLLIQMLGYIAPMSDVWIPSVVELSF